MENLQQDHLSEMDLNIDSEVRQHLFDAARWTKFISIVMFIGCGLLLLFGTLGGAALFTLFRNIGSEYAFLADFGGAIIIAIIVLVVAILALVYYFLYNFARKTKNALLSDNTEELNAGLRSLKVFFIITTVFAIISLCSNLYQLFR